LKKIEEGERMLGIVFPASYREFLLRLGAGSFGSAEFNGICTDDLRQVIVLNAVGLTLDLRRRCDLPPEMINVADTGYGEEYVIDTAHQQPDGESPVVTWYHGYRRGMELVEEAPTFGDFFLKEIESVLRRRSQSKEGSM
jgi:hypothetical protein